MLETTGGLQDPTGDMKDPKLILPVRFKSALPLEEVTRIMEERGS
ncbi:MAG: hypothetical protein ACYS0F_00030 [Planctomycetota bacterium]